MQPWIVPKPGALKRVILLAKSTPWKLEITWSVWQNNVDCYPISLNSFRLWCCSTSLVTPSTSPCVWLCCNDEGMVSASCVMPASFIVFKKYCAIDPPTPMFLLDFFSLDFIVVFGKLFSQIWGDSLYPLSKVCWCNHLNLWFVPVYPCALYWRAAIQILWNDQCPCMISKSTVLLLYFSNSIMQDEERAALLWATFKILRFLWPLKWDTVSFLRYLLAILEEKNW